MLFGFIALWITFAAAEAPATIELAEPVNTEPLKDVAKERSDDLETDATGWGGYYNGWGGNGYYGGRSYFRPWYGRGWGGRGYGGGWNRGWGWGGRGNGGWGGYHGGYWG